MTHRFCIGTSNNELGKVIFIPGLLSNPIVFNPFRELNISGKEPVRPVFWIKREVRDVRFANVEGSVPAVSEQARVSQLERWRRGRRTWNQIIPNNLERFQSS